jgi:hypothetical protein
MNQSPWHGLRLVWGFWTDYTHEVAEYQSAIWLGAVYYLVVGPTSILVRLSGRSLLPSTFGRSHSHWVARAPVQRDLGELRRQY